MKKYAIRVAAVIAVCSCMMFSSCIGSFKLTNKLLTWNNSIGTTISSCAFSNYLSVLTISDEDLTYHEFVTKEITINLIGSKWTFD